jgi:hypothetical protein
MKGVWRGLAQNVALVAVKKKKRRENGYRPTIPPRLVVDIALSRRTTDSTNYWPGALFTFEQFWRLPAGRISAHRTYRGNVEA